jgi:hypothetical protein
MNQKKENQIIEWKQSWHGDYIENMVTIDVETIYILK